MKTQEQLISRVLQRLGVLGADGQTPSAEDAATVRAEIGPVMSDLAARSIYAWGDPDQFEDAPFVHVAVIIANSLARDFGSQPSEQDRLLAESRLRELKAVALSGQPQQTEYY